MSSFFATSGRLICNILVLLIIENQRDVKKLPPLQARREQFPATLHLPQREKAHPVMIVEGLI